MKMLKGIAILFMLLLHLFARKDVEGLYETFPLINGVPLLYYLALFGDACVPVYCFASGYGLYVIMGNKQGLTMGSNFNRILKLLMNYWIVLILFVVIGYLVGTNELPGSPAEFFLNFFVLSNSYNGAWWFLQTYIILVVWSSVLMGLIKKNNSMVLLLLSGLLYLIAYLQRIRPILDYGDFTILNMLGNTLELVGTTQLPFVVGALFAKERTYSWIYKKTYHLRYKNTICTLCILMLVVIHAFYESMVIAPITGIAFICLFTMMNKTVKVQKIFMFFGDHSTNIWLTHMFFYMVIFPELTFAPKYPIIIFAWLIILCLGSSYIINFIYRPLLNTVGGVTALKQKETRVTG